MKNNEASLTSLIFAFSSAYEFFSNHNNYLQTFKTTDFIHALKVNNPPNKLIVYF